MDIVDERNISNIKSSLSLCWFFYSFQQVDKSVKEAEADLTCETKVGPTASGIKSKLGLMREQVARRLNSKYVFMAVLILLISVAAPYFCFNGNAPSFNYWIRRVLTAQLQEEVWPSHRHPAMAWDKKPMLYIPFFQIKLCPPLLSLLIFTVFVRLWVCTGGLHIVQCPPESLEGWSEEPPTWTIVPTSYHKL